VARQAILAIDQGTTNTKVLVFAGDGALLARASRPNRTDHPHPAWAEQSASAIWDGVVDAIAEVAAGDYEIAGIAVSNQRESVVVWDAATGEPVGPCILWQCRRTSDRCARLRDAGLEAEIVDRSGLAIDPLFSAAKIAWLLDQAPDGRPRAARGELRAGTIDSWLLWNLTGGRHATDVSNASRTQLFNLDTLSWDPRLADIFDVPLSILPEVLASNGGFGATTAEATALPAGVPILAMAGDSHAALFGHGVSTPGGVKVTCGTGSSILSLTDRRIRSHNGLSSTIAWGLDADVLHAVEGNISVSGHTAAFTVGLLGLKDEAELTALASSVPDSGGVVMVPAFVGLGAPHWNDQARGLVCGMTLGTTRAHVARAALEAIALQITDVLAAMEADLGRTFDAVHVDGGAAANDLLMQLLSDVSDRPIRRGASVELSALGAARMTGRVQDVSGKAVSDPPDFRPTMPPLTREALRTRWADALARTLLAPAAPETPASGAGS